MSGAQPLYLSAGFILEEGFPLGSLGQIVMRMAEASRKAGVQIVAGDTKVVERGHGDGCYINTSGIGVLADGVNIGPSHARPGDVIIVSGTIGGHGMAIMSVREGANPTTAIESDCAPLGDLVAVAPEMADRILERMYGHAVSENARIIGRVTDRHPGLVVSTTRAGATRVVPMQTGEQLPRVC
jgi:hydrogenase maturation factor